LDRFCGKGPSRKTRGFLPKVRGCLILGGRRRKKTKGGASVKWEKDVPSKRKEKKAD